MTFREKLADWISGGALSDERERADMCRDLYHDACDYDDQLEDMAASMKYALRHIAALETPHANATVRKMARIAREAVK